MKKGNLFGILISSLFLGAYLNFPLYCMVDNLIDGHQMGALFMGILFAFLVSIHFNTLQYKNDKLDEEIKELKKEIETLKNKDKE